MSEELRAAAEAISRFGIHADVETLHVPAEYIRESRKLADAYLREHPADDAEPVTPEWLRSVGFEQIGMKLDWPEYESPMSDRCGPTISVLYEPYLGCDGWRIKECECGLLLPPPETRGAVRDLCRALGVPLKEED